ncbi:hypothetical protein [Vibrio taketomensis]|nr:hypothetical protein [Vibrio taketomensis]
MSKLSQSDDSLDLELLDAIEIGIELREYPQPEKSTSEEECTPSE